MADTKITALTAATSAVDNDVLVIVTDTGTTPVTKKITKANLFTHIHKFVNVLSILANNGNVAASSTSYAQYGLTGLNAGGVPNLPYPLAGTWKSLTVRISSSQPASGSLVITLVHNNVDSALVVTIPAGSGSANYTDSTHTVTFAAGDLIYFKIVNNATGTSANIVSISMKMESDVV